MRRGAGQSLCVGVGASGVSLVRSGGWRGTGATLLAEQSFLPGERSHEGIGPALRALFSGHEHAGWPVSFVLDDALARLWQVTPPPGAAHLADLEAAAALRFELLYGEGPGAWSMTAGWDAVQPFFAAAVPRTLLAVLNDSAQEHGLAVVGIAPHFISAWNRWCCALKPGAWFGLMHDKTLCIGATDGGRLCAVRVVSLLALPPSAAQEWLTGVVTREALLLGLAAPTLLQLCGQVPAGLRQAGANPAHIASVALGAEKNGALRQSDGLRQTLGLSPAGWLAHSGSGA